MKKKTPKALKLNRDTLRLLEEHQLTPVDGGKTDRTACDGFGFSGCPNTCLC